MAYFRESLGTSVSNTQTLFRRALRQDEENPQTALNAVALWCFLDSKFPKCKFRSSIVMYSKFPIFRDLILEAGPVVGYLEDPESDLQAHQVDQELPLLQTRTVLINKDFNLQSLFPLEQETRDEYLRLVHICIGVCHDLMPRSLLQQAQNVDVETRTLEMTFLVGQPIEESDITEYITRYHGQCIETIVLDHRSGTLVLHTPEDVTKVMGDTAHNTKLFTIKNKLVWITRRVRFIESFGVIMAPPVF